MTKPSLVLIALAVSTASALAQPGNTPPGDPGMPPGEPSPPPPPNDVGSDTGAGGFGAGRPKSQLAVDIETMLAKIEAEAPSLEKVLKGTANRARRAVSVGPTIGFWSGSFFAQSEFENALTFGLGVEVFKVPILPDPATIKALIMERAKAQLKAHLLGLTTGVQTDPLQVESIAKQIYDDVRKELLGLENTRAKRFERPRFTFAFEVNRLLGEGNWIPRTRVGLGVWKFTLGLSVAGACLGGPCADRLELYTGPEVVLHMLTSKNPRASVIDGFLRVDLQATGRDELDPYDQLVIGARFLLDII